MDRPSSEKITAWRQSSASLDNEIDREDEEELVPLLDDLPEDEDVAMS